MVDEHTANGDAQQASQGEIPEGAPEGCSGSCGSCGVEGCGARTEGATIPKFETNSRSDVKKAIAVVSGKGGVGKSLVTSLLAAELTRQGKKVAILDADVTGPSIPKAFGATEHPKADEDGINPISTPDGIKMMSVNLMLPNDDIPVAWRGPVITGVLNQFWSEVNWGDIDVMLLDMPPGTSDVFLTIMQMFPIDGIVTVSAPQELVSMIVGKAVNLAKNMDVPVIGLVENMAYYECDDCGKRHEIFGKPQGKNIAEKYDIEATAELPIDPKLAESVDDGRVMDYDTHGALKPIVEAIEKA